MFTHSFIHYMCMHIYTCISCFIQHACMCIYARASTLIHFVTSSMHSTMCVHIFLDFTPVRRTGKRDLFSL